MFRPFLSLVLGAVAFLAFFFYLLSSLVDGHLLSPDFYAQALAEQDAYSRLYDEVLVDPELEDPIQQALGDVDVPQEDVADVARRIMPPAYLQAEVERSLETLVGYLKRDTDELELYIELAAPLDRAAGELVAYAEARIDQIALEEVEEGILQPDDKTVELQTEAEWADYWESTLRDLETGRLPDALPSLAGVPVETRLDAYDRALAELQRADNVPKEVLEALRAPETDAAIRQALSREDTLEEQDAIRDALKAASGGVLPSLVDDSLDDLRRKLLTADGTSCEDLPPDADLSRCTRYDLLGLVDADIETSEVINNARDGLRLAGVFGSWLPMAVLVGACVLIVAVNMPSLASILRWLGIVLGSTGLLCLVAGIVAGQSISNRLDSALQHALEDADAPPSLGIIASDVTSHMADVISTALTSPSLTLMLVGLAMLAASMLIRKLPIVRRIPFISALPA